MTVSSSQQPRCARGGGRLFQALAICDCRTKALRCGRITHGGENISDAVRLDCKFHIDASMTDDV